MDIIEQATEVSDEQQKHHITEELLEKYEALLNASWELILEQRMVINGEIDKNELNDSDERLDAMSTMENAIKSARACLRVE